MDDRAAKAARAKEKASLRLKRFQAAKNQKAATETANVTSPTTAANPSLSPPPRPTPATTLAKQQVEVPPRTTTSPLPPGIPPPPKSKKLVSAGAPPTNAAHLFEQPHPTAGSSVAGSSRGTSFELEPQVPNFNAVASPPPAPPRSSFSPSRYARQVVSPPPAPRSPPLSPAQRAAASIQSLFGSPVRTAVAPQPEVSKSTESRANSAATLTAAQDQGSIVESQKQTIQLLVADKERMSARIRDLEQTQASSPISPTTSSTAEDNAAARSTNNKRLQDELSTHKDESHKLARELQVAQHSLLELQTQLSSKNKALLDVQSQLRESQSIGQTSGLESKLRSARDRADALELELNKARLSITKYKTDQDTLEAQFEASRQNLDKAIEDARIATDEAANARQQLQELKSETSTSGEARAAVDKQVIELQAALTAAQTQLSAAQADSTRARAKVESLENALSTAESNASKSAARRDSLQGENVELMASLEELRGKVVALSNEKATMQDQVAVLQQSNKEKEARIHVLGTESSSEANRLRQELEEAQLRRGQQSHEATAEAENKLREAQRRIDMLEGELSDVRDQHHAEREQRIEFEQEIDQHQARLKEMEQQLEVSTANGTATQSQVDSLREELAQVEAQRRDSETTLKAVRAELADARDHHLAQLSELQHRVEMLTSSETSHTSRAQLLEAQLTELETVKATHETTIASLRAELVDADEKHAAALRQLQERLDQANAEADDGAAAKLVELQAQVTELETKDKESCETLAAVKDELKALQEQYDELLTQHEEALDQIASETNSLEQHAAELERVRGQLTSTTIRADALEKQHATVQQTLATTKKQHEDAMILLEEAKTKDVAGAQELVTLKTELDKNAEKLKLTEQELEQARQALSEERSRVEAAEQRAEAARTELEAATKQLDELENLRDQFVTTQRRAQDAEDKLTAAHDQLASVSEASTVLQAELDQTRSTVASLQAEVDALKAKLAETSSRPAHIVYEGADGATERISQLETELGQARAAADAAKTNIVSQSSTIQKMRLDHKKMVETTTDHSRRVEELRKMVEKKDFDASRLAADVAKVKTENATIRAENESLSRAKRMGEQLLHSARATVAKLEAELGETKSQLASSRSTAGSLQQVLDTSEQTSDERDIELMKLRESLSAANSRVAELEFSLETVTQKAAASASRAHDLDDSLSEERMTKTQALESARSELSKLRAELSEATQRADDADRARTTVTEEAARLRSRVDQSEEHQGLMAALREQVRSLESELGEARRELERIMATNAALEAEREQASRRSTDEQDVAVAAAVSAKDRLQRELDQIKAELAASIKERRELETAFAKSQVVVEEREATAQSAQDDVDSLKNALAEREMSLQSTRNQLNAATNRSAELDDKLNMIQAQLNTAQTSSSTADRARIHLEERIQTLEAAVKDKDLAMSELESKLGSEVDLARKTAHERTRQASRTERELKAILASGNERASEVDRLRTVVQELEQQVTSLRSGEAGSSIEVESLTEELKRNVGELESLKQLIDGEREQLSQARSELEHAQSQLTMKSTEIDQLRMRISGQQTEGEVVSNPYDREYVDSIQQQHELEISEARAQIRSLEQRVFAAEDARHEMLKANGDLKSQIESLESILRDERTALRVQDASSPYDQPFEQRHDLEQGQDGDYENDQLHNHGYEFMSRQQQTYEGESDPSSIVSTPTRSGHARHYSHRRAPSTLATVDENADPAAFEEAQQDFDSANSYNNHRALQVPVSMPVNILSPPLVPVDNTAAMTFEGPQVDRSFDRDAAAARRSSRHVRKESLSLLKQRMQSELGIEDLRIAGRGDEDEKRVVGFLDEDQGMFDQGGDEGMRTSRARLSQDKRTTSAKLQDSLVWWRGSIIRHMHKS
ncbi:hypothetical protein OIO90_002481 [Microbotryomycetes sp. JL221]|nr:hypothetical protein OIO90_002481 [Microbotryomycetes sp. JL221]